MRTEFALRFDYGSTVPWVTRTEDGTLRAIAGPDMVVLATSGAACEVKGCKRSGEFAVAAGESRPSRLSYAPSHRPLPPSPDPMQSLTATEALLARLVGALRRRGEWSEVVAALADHSQGADLRADRRHRCGADDLAAGAARRLAQLGLPLLLAPRRDLHPPGPAQRRLLDGGVPLARLVAAGRGRQPEPDADHVRPGRRAAADGVGGAVAARLRGVPAGQDRQRRSCPAAARRLWRADGRAAPVAARRPRSRRCRLGPAARAAGPSRAGLVPA